MNCDKCPQPIYVDEFGRGVSDLVLRPVENQHESRLPLNQDEIIEHKKICDGEYFEFLEISTPEFNKKMEKIRNIYLEPVRHFLSKEEVEILIDGLSLRIRGTEPGDKVYRDELDLVKKLNKLYHEEI